MTREDLDAVPLEELVDALKRRTGEAGAPIIVERPIPSVQLGDLIYDGRCPTGVAQVKAISTDERGVKTLSLHAVARPAKPAPEAP